MFGQVTVSSAISLEAAVSLLSSSINVGGKGGTATMAKAEVPRCIGCT